MSNILEVVVVLESPCTTTDGGLKNLDNSHKVLGLELSSGSNVKGYMDGLSKGKNVEIVQEVQISPRSRVEVDVVSNLLGAKVDIGGHLALKRDGVAIDSPDSPMKKYREQTSDSSVEEPLVAIFSPGVGDSSVSRRKKRFVSRKKNIIEGVNVVEFSADATNKAGAAGHILPPPSQ